MIGRVASFVLQEVTTIDILHLLSLDAKVRTGWFHALLDIFNETVDQMGVNRNLRPGIFCQAFHLLALFELAALEYDASDAIAAGKSFLVQSVRLELLDLILLNFHLGVDLFDILVKDDSFVFVHDAGDIEVASLDEGDFSLQDGLQIL